MNEYLVGGIVAVVSYIAGEFAAVKFDQWRERRSRGGKQMNAQPAWPSINLSIDIGDLPSSRCEACPTKFYAATEVLALRARQRHMASEHPVIR